MSTVATLPVNTGVTIDRIESTAVIRLDPRTSFIAYLSFAVWIGTMTALLPLSIALGAVFILTLIPIGQGDRNSERHRTGLAWVLIAGMITIILYALFGPNEDPAGFSIIGISLNYQAMRLGLAMALRLVSLVFMSALLLRAIPAMELAAAITRLILPLRRVGVPVANFFYFSFFLTRMIPSLVQEARMIGLAQRSRGLAPKGAWGPKRWKGSLALIIPVFASALRRSDSMALTFASRGFDSTHIPVRVLSLRMRTIDGLVSVILAAGWIIWLYPRVA